MSSLDDSSASHSKTVIYQWRGLLTSCRFSSFNKSVINFLYSKYEWLLNNAFAIDFFMILFCLIKVSKINCFKEDKTTFKQAKK
jgi:hypothetical protein